MTEQPGKPAASGPPSRGRHHRENSRNRPLLIVLTLVVAVVAVAGVVTWLVKSNTDGSTTAATTSAAKPGQVAAVGTSGTSSSIQSSADSCPLDDGDLAIAASPDIAEVVTALATSAGTPIAGGCTVTVTAADPG